MSVPVTIEMTLSSMCIVAVIIKISATNNIVAVARK
jgi:hypothetical protein